MPYREQGKHKSVEAGRFAMVPRNDVPRSAFDYRAGHKTTFSGGWLNIIHCEEVLPGDSFKFNMTAFARLASPVVPIMDNLYMETFWFFVPNRLVWEHWQRFMGEQLDPTDTTQFLVPQVPVTTDATAPGSPADLFGITLNAVAGRTIEVNALPFRAFNLIFNEWFRDEDLVTPAVVNVDDGPDVITDYPVRSRGKRHDYITSARPWPQKPLNQLVFNMNPGQPLIPGQNMTLASNPFFGAGAPVSGLSVFEGNAATLGGSGPVVETGARTLDYPGYYNTGTDSFLMRAQPSGLAPDVRVLVNDIRTAVMVQGFMEKNARGGTRYAELVRSHFGVTSPDARLQRPEYLGGGRSNITINPVAQSVEGTGGRALGELAGTASTIHRSGFSQSFTEHGFIIGIANVRADLSYQHGTETMWFRRTVFDYYWPSTAHLGEQAVLKREIWSDGSATDLEVFGYQERWAEYKWRGSRISGGFRSNVVGPATSIDVWHLAQEFGAAPVLNETFITDVPPLARVLNETTFYAYQVMYDHLIDIRAVRCMPMFSVPGLGPRL